MKDHIYQHLYEVGMLLKLLVGFKIAMATKQSRLASSGVLAAERESKLKQMSEAWLLKK